MTIDPARYFRTLKTLENFEKTFGYTIFLYVHTYNHIL